MNDSILITWLPTILKSGLLSATTWQPGKKMNVACFLCGGLAGAFPEIVGEPYVDASDRTYLSLVRQPVLIFGADGDQLLRAMERAQEREVAVAIYTEDLFHTYNDIDNRGAVWVGANCRVESGRPWLARRPKSGRQNPQGP